ncbi:sigma-70 family RNA polymerase sigma factor [Kribbella qitaiheensis]|uniref:Sigma-70 family RNA polymerase sigma factor n=2 Tax=Kribbella qitaiheensis TaxID=1544730 RepID=A0A7G6X9F6_9ACTN|nr:sigma-70 family RNA polymerase sigma factor [Kribbella qitaiheensis]
MEQVADGDRDAFSALYDVAASRAFGIALRLLRNPALAEEVAQDAMVELWRTAARYDPGRGSVETWTLTIAHRRAVDRVRRDRAGKERDLEDARASTISFDATAETATRHTDIRGCLLSLTDLQRQAVVLAFYEGYSYPEVAALLEVTLPTIKAPIRDGLRRLRDCLTPVGAA